MGGGRGVTAVHANSPFMPVPGTTLSGLCRVSLGLPGAALVGESTGVGLGVGVAAPRGCGIGVLASGLGA